MIHDPHADARLLAWARGDQAPACITGGSLERVGHDGPLSPASSRDVLMPVTVRACSADVAHPIAPMVRE